MQEKGGAGDAAAVPFCSNCGMRPVTAARRCFDDWCFICDDSLYSTKDVDDVAPMSHFDLTTISVSPFFLILVIAVAPESVVISPHNSAPCNVYGAFDNNCDDDYCGDFGAICDATAIGYTKPKPDRNTNLQ